MNIVVPKESFALEKRVMVLPAASQMLAKAGHHVFVQAGAGSGINVPDKKYASAGATIISEPQELYAQAQNGMVIKLKAPTAEEFSFMERAIVFSMLHMEQNPERHYFMGARQLVGVPMEELKDNRNERLIDQTDLTGQMGVLYAIRHFQKMPLDMKAVILGYGHVGHGAIAACSKLGIDFKIMRKIDLRKLALWLKNADLLINAIAWPKEQRDKQEYLVTTPMVQNSKPGMIVLDLSADFPNPIQTIHPTDYQNPYYLEEGRVHISLYGYPGLVPVTSSRIYSAQVLPIALAIAKNGGLDDIRKVRRLGPCIQKVVVDPAKSGDWEKYKPEIPAGPRTE